MDDDKIITVDELVEFGDGETLYSVVLNGFCKQGEGTLI